MKFNYRKIMSMAASAIMLGSTVAAATFPAPFVEDGTAMGAVVVGANAAASDWAAAIDLQTNLNNKVTTTSTDTGAETTGGDSVKIAKGSEDLNLKSTNDALSEIWSSAITDTDLPTLLADGTYRNDENTEYDFTQKIDLGGDLAVTHFSDSDYNDKEPTLGFQLSGSTEILNYTMDFTTAVESTSTSGDLVDIETTEITLLGRQYYVLDASNSTDGADLTLLDAAESTLISEGETKTLSVNGVDYDVSLPYVGSDSARVTVNGETTNSLGATETYKLSDGAYVGVKEILYSAKDSGISQVELSVGSGKLKLVNGSTVEFNDDSIDDITSTIDYSTSTSSSKEKINEIKLSWKLEDEAFFTPSQELVMPGFEAVKLSMAEIVYPAKELTTVEHSNDDVMELKTTIKSGDVTIPLFKGDTTSGNLTLIGKDTDERLATGNGTTKMFYDAKSGYNEGFVVSWNNSRDAESYYLEASVSRDSSGARTNRTTIKNKVTSQDLCKDLKAADTCTLNNIVLTVDSVGYSSSSSRNVTLSVNDGGTFNRLYTDEGLTVYLPIDGANTSTTKGSINFTANATTAGHSPDMFTLWMQSEDKDGNLGAGSTFNMTIDSSGTTTRRLTVDNVYGDGTAYETESSSKVWRSYVAEEVATMIEHDKTNSDQYSATVEYHGAEVVIDVFVAAPSAEIIEGSSTTGEGGNVVVVKDSEVSSVSGKNLVVVGGSCINTVAAKMLGSDSPVCGADFSELTNTAAGQYLIKVAASPYSDEKVAMLVAGYDAEDTTNAVAKAIEGVATDVDTENVYPLATA